MKCAMCETPVKRRGNITCSKACDYNRRKITFKGRTLNTGKTHFVKGERPHNYKGGRQSTYKGYKIIHRPEHPTANKRGYVREHRYVMEVHLGRPLTKDENIHHINGVRDDNRLENLELWSTSQPSGQRVSDKVKWAKEILEKYCV